MEVGTGLVPHASLFLCFEQKSIAFNNIPARSDLDILLAAVLITRTESNIVFRVLRAEKEIYFSDDAYSQVTSKH